MTVIPLNCVSESDRNAVRGQLDRILKSAPFHQSRRRQRFLEYLVNETLAGRGERLKAYNVALAVFDRPETFDPLIDPVVRIEAGRLRDKLREYYDTEGQNDSVRIELPKGCYTPHFERGQADARGAPAVIFSAEPQVQTISEPSARYGWEQVGIFATAILIIVVGIAWLTMDRNAVLSLPEKPSIAVLPFDNIGDDPKWDRFADGMTEDIISDLARFKDFIVIARNSTSVYKGKPIEIRRIGRDLGVEYVVVGTIQSSGARIRVDAQLIETGAGRYVWSERYDRPADDLFDVQKTVTERIAATLGGYEGAVAEAERNLIRRKPPASLTAFDTYLLAMEAKHKVTKEGFFEAERLLHKALELDPQLARAYAGLVDVECYLIDLGLAPSVDEAVSKMTKAAEMAVKFDPNDGKSHLALGFSYSYRGKPEQAASEFSRAETLAPSDADVLVLIAWYLPQLGGSARAVELADRSLKLNPHYPPWYNQGLSLAFFFGEQYDKAVKYRLLVKEPLALDYAFLAMANAYLGRAGEAATAAANVKRLAPTWNAERYLSEAGGYAEKEAELFISGARKAGLSDCISADKLKAMPNLIRIKSCDRQRPKITG